MATVKVQTVADNETQMRTLRYEVSIPGSFLAVRYCGACF